MCRTPASNAQGRGPLPGRFAYSAFSRRSGARAGARAGRDRGDDARGHGQGLAHRQRRLQRAAADRVQPRGRRVPAADDRVRRQPQGHLPRDVPVGGGPQEAVRGHGAPRLLQCGGRRRPRLPAGPHGPADLSDRALEPQRVLQRSSGRARAHGRLQHPHGGRLYAPLPPGLRPADQPRPAGRGAVRARISEGLALPVAGGRLLARGAAHGLRRHLARALHLRHRRAHVPALRFAHGHGGGGGASALACSTPAWTDATS